MPLADTLALPFERLRARYARSPLSGFLRWWGRELLACVPASWQHWLRSEEPRLWLSLQDDELRVAAWRDEGWQTLAGVPLDEAATLPGLLGEARAERAFWLLLPARQVLRRPLTLPLAAGQRLRDVLAHEIDRQTPFRADQAVYDWRVRPDGAGQGQLQVELVVAPRPAFDDVLARLGPLAARLEGVDAVDADGAPLGVNLLPPERRLRRRDPVLWINLALVAFTALALGYALWQSLENRRDAVAALQAEVEARRVEARRVSALRERLVDAAEGANFLARTRAQRPAMVEILDDLSRRLPDGTWLERLNVQENRLVLTGYSNEASATVGRLQGSPWLASAALAGSVQADPRTGRDRFTLTADVVAAREAADGAAPAR
ncbi:MAG: PilN domain-containing protein [Rehaibacterium terrae]|uniref:PilN domain-containing protein n=1 Tax=Rehaibacterium terrae TaxID=1341696 RepID=UPI00391D2AA8